MPAPTPIPPILRGRPFTLETARAAGISVEVLRGRRFRRLFPRIYLAAEIEPTVEIRAEAARLLLPGDAVFSHGTAALLRDMPLHDDGRVHATVRRVEDRRRIGGLSTHLGTFRADHDVVGWRALPITSAPRTFVDLAADLGLVDLVILGDALVRRGFTNSAELRAAAHDWPGRYRTRLARAAALVRGRVDSPMETRTRLIIIFAGLPEPEPGVEVISDDGGWIATVDLAYPKARVAIEYDGDLHRTSKRKWRYDVRARDLLHQAGWDVIVLTADDVYLRPVRTLWRIQDALRSRGPAEVPERLDLRRLAELPWVAAW